MDRSFEVIISVKFVPGKRLYFETIEYAENRSKAVENAKIQAMDYFDCEYDVLEVEEVIEDCL